MIFANRFSSLVEGDDDDDEAMSVPPPPAPLMWSPAKGRSHKEKQSKPKSRKKSTRFMCTSGCECENHERSVPPDSGAHVNALFQPCGVEIAATTEWQWVRMDSVMDSCSAVSVAPPNVAPWAQMTESEGSRTGVEYTAADGG